MILKNDNVSLQNLSPQIVLALLVAQGVYSGHGRECVVTSANDSTHSRTSLHYSGNAVDLRLLDPATGEHIFDAPYKVAEEIQENLNEDFDVVYENDHIHIEYQPKRKD